MICHGVPEIVIVKGRVCVEHQKVEAEPGFGRFLKRYTFNPFIFGK
jgi:dihydropyrimidinase